MTNNDSYNALLEKVQKKGGYAIVPNVGRPSFKTKEGFVIYAAAIYESADDSSPLKVIDTMFNSWDVCDYLNDKDFEYLTELI